ncbi:hypothetical protein EYF88_00495 [Paracoccus sediminis]|uniref:Protoporphyrinogen IX oxidase n=1 Tax=Paracoccus sediminis TaxID=1214787 RepID=A0A238UWK9_9RHOB|nr:CopD family protein [Paracoccus sediminis]TBN52722.1 hypothetical protein EYF88_00495 [Paracoccus sediminis]SNR26396.1 Uncharacterized membrane protein [Paracoccus sediminis]
MTEILKALHIAAIAVWSAGLLSLPALYVQRRHVRHDDDLHRLQRMVRFSYIALVSPMAFVGIASGTALIFVQTAVQPWFAAKMAFVAALAFVHVLTGLVVVRLFREDGVYPAWRFVAVTAATAFLIAAILWLVLAKPVIPQAADMFRPGALSGLLRPFNPWATP